MRIKVLCPRSRVNAVPFEYAPGYVFVEDPTCRDYDWLLAYDELQVDREYLACPRERTILMTSEPTSIKSYSRAYTGQFGHLLTNRPYDAERHPGYRLGRGYYRWFVGRDCPTCRQWTEPVKDRIVSACISAKKMRHTRHGERFELMEELARAIPGLDWFGRGVRPFGKKYEVLDPYRYHVVVENHIAPHHWSEKIADAFLCGCLPFYAGDPLLAEVFPAESFIPIPIDDSTEAVRIVKTAIAAGEYEKRCEAVREARRRILEKYNFWAQTIAVIEESREQRIAPVAGPVVIYGRKALRLRSPLAALEDGWQHLRHWFAST